MSKKMNNSEVYKEFKKLGLRVKIRHSRVYANTGRDLQPTKYYQFDKKQALALGFKNVMNWGGLTEVAIYNKDSMIVEDSAECSWSDNFSKKYGVRLALRRALNKLSKEQKAKLNKVFMLLSR